MFRQSSLPALVAVFVSSIVLTALALILALKLTIAPSYSDFIVGSITWNAGTKLQDLIAAPVFISAIFSSLVLFSFLLKRQERLLGSHSAIELSNQLILWSLPAIATILSLILGGNIDKTLFFISAAGIGFIGLASRFCASKVQPVDAQTLGFTALSIGFLALLPLELALLLGRAPISLVGDINIAKYKSAAYVIFVFGLVWSFFVATRWPQTLLRALPRLMLMGQIGLSTLFLTLYPARLLQTDGTLTKYETTAWLKLFVLGLIVYGIFDVLRRYSRNRSSESGLFNLLSPIALFALLVGLRVGNTVAPHISPDDYHFGESLLGWWSYFQGAIPYVGYVPAHGLIENDFNLFLSSIFYDGTAGSVAEASRLGFTILAFSAFLSLYSFSGSLGLAFVAVLFFGGIKLSWLFLTPFLCLWFNRALLQVPSQWLIVWIATAPMLVLGLPPQGLLLVAASGVIAVYFLWRMWRYPSERKWTGVGVSVASLSFLALATPLGLMLLGAVRYVVENAPVNQLAYGMPWDLSWNTGEKSGLIFEVIRMSWVAIPLGCLAIIFVSSKDTARKDYTILPAIVIFLFALLLIPYSMGRIDPGGLSRPGIAAIFGWAILLPIAAWGVLETNNRVLLFLLMVFTSASLGFSSLSFRALVSATSSKINIGVLKDAVSAGLANIGKASVQDDHWERLSRLNELLDANLSPRETYLDLTSRNAQYFYLDRRPAVPVTAAYNMVPSSLQKRTVEELSKDVPRLALFEGANIIHDGGGLALRTPYLYRFAVENYIPRYENGFIIGLAKKQLKDIAAPEIEVTVKNISDANWDRGIHRQDSAIVIDNPHLLSLLNVGDSVTISGGEVRVIAKIAADINSLWLEGARMEPGMAGHPNKVQVAVAPQVMAEYKQALFQAAFSQSDLQKIPVSWGRSEKSLKKQMSLVKRLDEIAPALHQFHVDSGVYKVGGDDPSLSLDISNLGLSGKDAGLLRFEFSCVNKAIQPRIQVFWWGDSHQGPFEASSIIFTADDGVLIVPLDASPRWLLLEHLKGIRIDLDNASACGAIKVRNISLYRRTG